jgi:Ca-activated chloride channel family protein
MVLPTTREGLSRAALAVPSPEVPELAGRDEIDSDVTGGDRRDVMLDIGTARADSGEGLFGEGPVTAVKPIEALLKARISVYTHWLDRRYGYFRIEVERIAEEVLPVIPKDIALVQDCSASMTEQRLYFCRQGLLKCLAEIGPRDRYNVISFRDGAEMCFEDWQSPDAEAGRQAEQFIAGMWSGGNTDIFGSIEHLAELKRVPGRPMIALVISDGISTAGLTRSSDIIGEFTTRNDGVVSVFALGTAQTANAYLLDLLSYCNGGDAFVVTRGRWEIPEAIPRLLREVSRPVLSDVAFRFAADTAIEVYPRQTGNLYLDRPMVIHGRYPRGQERVVFQAMGRTGAVDCDMVFDLPLDRGAEAGDRSIRAEWAKQKVYDLIGRYAREGDAAVLGELHDTAQTYRIEVPYKDRL